ncbi:hypothetical protein K470DRAFT_291577 [Piedraia hortae CBS 480.64]|uniref:MYND-type zinc finger protein samB n=1 Tax=Piedraia hortae CBS 480.64 TaxID=1314780 RepID=A0A6A7C6E0_9PEZI|nr:hypothetical protein K470DRAFT_291577 [Piedraia hortae CBS 480.64]
MNSMLVEDFNALPPTFGLDPWVPNEWIFGFRTTLLAPDQEYVFAMHTTSDRCLLAGLRKIFGQDTEVKRAINAVELLFRAFVDQSEDPGLQWLRPDYPCAPTRWYCGNESLRRPMMEVLNYLNIREDLKIIHETNPIVDMMFNRALSTWHFAPIFAYGLGITGGKNTSNCPYCVAGLRPRRGVIRMRCLHSADIRFCTLDCQAATRHRHMYECTNMGPISDALRTFVRKSPVSDERHELARRANIMLPSELGQFEGFSKPIRRLLQSGLFTNYNLQILFGLDWPQALSRLAADIRYSTLLGPAPGSMRQLLNHQLDVEPLTKRNMRPRATRQEREGLSYARDLRHTLGLHLRFSKISQMKFVDFLEFFEMWGMRLDNDMRLTYVLILQCMDPNVYRLQEWERAMISIGE